MKQSSIAHNRKKLGIRLESSEGLKQNNYFPAEFFKLRTAYLHLRLTGVGAEKRKEFLQISEDELHILALSQLGYRGRADKCSPCITDQININGKVSFLLFNSSNNSWAQHNYVTGHSIPLLLDNNWISYHREFFFFILLRILRGEIHVERNWKETLYNAAILGGMSQCTTDKTAAFLWNMIAIEMLTTLEREKYADILPERIEAFFGWVGNWDAEKYGEKIEDAYKKRCAIVHSGKRSLVEPHDLYFTDIVLFNLFSTLVKHHKMFQGKTAIKNFCDRVKAEKLLNVKTKTRPNTLQFVQRPYFERDYI